MQNQNANNKVAQKATAYLKENEGLLKKFKLAMRPVVNFPFRRKTPLLSKIALWIVNKQGGLLDIQFTESKK